MWWKVISVENKIKDLLEKYSDDSFKKDVQSLTPPVYHQPLPDFKVGDIWAPGESPAEKFDALLNFNKEISQSLTEAQIEIKSLREELKQLKKSHKYDVLKQILAGVIVALISSAITIFASSKGWLHG